MNPTRFAPAILTVLCAVVLSLSTPAEAGENVWTTNGPPAPVQFLASPPSDSSTIYAAGNPGPFTLGPSLFKTVDGGQSWSTLPAGDLSTASMTCLAVDPNQPGGVYAGITRYNSDSTVGEFLRSRDGGAVWESAPIDPQSYFSTAIAVEPGTGSIYLGQDALYSAAGPVLRSTDGGSTWSGTTLGRPRSTYALLSDSLNRTLLVGTDFAYVAGWYYYGVGGNIARTTDGGATWTLSPVDLGAAVVSLAMNAQGTMHYAGTQAGTLLSSTDAGASWAPLASIPGAGAIAALVVDPSNASTLYAATEHRGLFRSTDAGATWYSFNAGLPTRNVTSLTIGPAGRVLHVGTDRGVFDLQIAPETAPDTCAPGADHLCLFGSRFRVDLLAVDPFTRKPFAAHAVADDARSGYFTFPTLTGDASFPEVLVKMVDATSLPGAGYWVYYAGMTSVLYTLRITDTTTGLSHEYGGENSCGGADVGGFLPGSAPDAGSSRQALGTPRAASFSDSNLTLLNGRFRVTMTAHDPATDADVTGRPIPQADRFGAFSLPDLTGDPSLPEVFVKMIDATGGSFLLFYSGLTHLDYTLTVFDTITGTESAYVSENALVRRPCGSAQLMKFAQ